MSVQICDNKNGVTLLELVLVMVLIGILAAIIVVPVITGARAWNEMSRQKEVVQQARIGLERLVRELRAIQRVNGRPSIVSMGPTNVLFSMITDDGLKELGYSWAGAGQPLVRTEWSGGVATPDNAALNVQNFALTYYEDSNALIAQMRQEAEAAPVTCSPGPCDVQGGLVVLNALGESVTYGFKGTGVAWIGPKGGDLGIANLQIVENGTPLAPSTLDQYASVAVLPQPLFSSPRLNYATHTITVGFSGTQNPSSIGSTIRVDAFDLVISQVVIDLEVGESEFTTTLRDQVSFRRVE